MRVSVRDALAPTTPRRRPCAGYVVGCVLVAGSSLFTATPAIAAPDAACTAALGGDWDYQNGACTSSLTSQRKATMSIAVGLPVELLNDPTAGPVLCGYLRSLVDGWNKTSESMVRDSIHGVDYRLYSHSDTVKSVVFHEFWQTNGVSANNAYRTFTFDLAHAKHLQLADLFAPGVDTLTAIPPLARPYLSDALNLAPPPHDRNTYPFTTQEWEPQPDGSSGYSGNYRAFALTADDLILYMPDAPMAHEDPFPRGQLVWSMDGGTVAVQIPLATLAPILRAI